MIKLGAKDLRMKAPAKEELGKIKKNPIYIIVDGVLDTYNVGGIFRLSEAVAAEKVYLCGETETPPNSRIKKASINTAEWVNWEYKKTAIEAIEDLRLKISGIQIIAIEQDRKSVPYAKIDYKFPIALVVGHESNGISKEVLKIVDYVAEIPMWGVNKSLNVIVSLGIVIFDIMNRMEYYVGK